MTDKKLEAVARSIDPIIWKQIDELVGWLEEQENSIMRRELVTLKEHSLKRAQAAIDAMPAQASQGWQDIETAPTGKNEFTISERMLVLVPPYGASCAHYDNGWNCHSILNKEAEPTHWMPLPEPPQENSQEGET